MDMDAHLTKMESNDVSCFAMVASAYAKAGMGIKGAMSAERIVETYISLTTSTAQKKNRVLLSAVVKAWALADDWTRAKKWLDRMIRNAQENPEFGPDAMTYTAYIDALAKSTVKSNNEVKDEALDILEHMKTLPSTAQQQPNTYTYDAVMKCVARTNDMETMEVLLKDLVDRYNNSNIKDRTMKPSARSYGAVMDAWSKSGRGLYAAQRADALLQELNALYQTTGDIGYHPNEYAYTFVLTSYARVDPTDISIALARTEQLLLEFERDELLSNSPQVYSAAMQVRVNPANPTGAQEAEALLRRITTPDKIAYQTVIMAYAARDQPHAAERLLEEMIIFATARGSNEPAFITKHGPTPITVAACAQAWLRCSRDETDVERADRLVRRLGAMYQDRMVPPNERHIDRWIFHAVLLAWAEQACATSGMRAEALMQVMNTAFRGTMIQRQLTPTNETYVLTLDAWAASGHANCGSRAMRLLEELEVKHQSDPIHFPPPNNRALFPTILSVVKSGEEGMVESAKELFSRICQLHVAGDASFDLNSKTTTSILREFSTNPAEDAGYRAESLLEHVINISTSDDAFLFLRPGTIEYNCVINVHAKKGSIQGAKKILLQMKAMEVFDDAHTRPNLLTYSSVLEGFIYTSQPNVLVQAESLFQEVVQRWTEGDESLKPDVVLFNTMFTLLAKVEAEPGPIVEKGFALLAQMQDLSIVPTTAIYGMLCRMCLNDGTVASMELLEQMLKDAEVMTHRGMAPPLERSVYEQALTTYLYSKAEGSHQRAKALFAHLEQLAKSGKVHFQLDRSTIHLLLAGWARRGGPDSVQEAVLLLDKMKKQQANESMKPTINSYNWVLLATTIADASSPEDQKAHFSVAMAMFKEVHTLLPDVVPNYITYGTFLKACWKLVPETSREVIIGKAWTLCIKNGCVSQDIFSMLERWAPTLLASALQGQSSIPEEWHRNVPLKKRALVADQFVPS